MEVVDPPRATTSEELIERGHTRPDANTQAVRANLQAAMEAGFARWGRIWISLIFGLFVGLLVVLIWSEWVYDHHRDDVCDRPFGMLLGMIFVIVALHAFKGEIIRHILCYNMYQDGLEEPVRVKAFRWATCVSVFLWPAAGLWMLATSRENTCQELKKAVGVLTGYYAVVAIVAFILPAMFITVMLCLIRRGLVQMPRRPNAAPEVLIDQLPTIAYDPSRFGDGTSGAFPAACPICMEDFEAGPTQITKTPCQVAPGHVFHTECLRGWLNCARTCPLCRLDLTTIDPEAGTELASELASEP